MTETAKTKKMAIERVSSEEILDLFEKSFEDQIVPFSNIDSFGVECTRDVTSKKAIVNVTIYGTAGSPTIDDFKANRVAGADRVSIQRFDIGELNFALKPELTCFLNSNDYLIVYESI